MRIIAVPQLSDSPYRENYGYDVWGNTVSQTNRLWTGSPFVSGATYVNNRRDDFSYDANGFVTGSFNGGFWTEHTYDAAGKRTHFVPGFWELGGWPVVEIDDLHDGDGLASKHLDTRRGEDPETLQIYSVTTVTYYLHSTVLGGQVVAELDAQGNKSSGYIYAQGMKIAKETMGGPSGVVDWQYTDPVTGSNGMTNISREHMGMTELDTLGADVTYPPPPPDPQTYQAPVYVEPLKQTYYQVEGGPSDSYGVDQWYTNMVNKDFDRHMAEIYWKHGFRDWAQAIVANNPNVGVLSKHYNTSGQLTGIGLRWGAQAAGFLFGISRDIESGRLVEDNSEQYGEVLGYELDSPQNTGAIGKALEALSKPTCIDFYTRVLNSPNVNTKSNPVLEGGDLSKIFQHFLNQKKGGLTRKPIPGGAGFGSTNGLIRPGKKNSNGTIYLPPGSGDWVDAVGLVGEIFHLAGSKAMYYDYELAVAVHNIPEFAAKFPSALGAKNNVFDPAYTGNAKDRYDGGYSTYFHNIERIFCEVSK